MSKKIFRLPTPSMLIAMVALFVALTSTAYAASLQKNSVTTKTIKNNAVTGAKIKGSTITGSDIKNDSITGADVNESTLGSVPSAASATSAGTATSAATASSVAANSIDSASVKDRSLTPLDVTHASGSFVLNLASIPAFSCTEAPVDTNNGVDMKDDAIVLTAGDDWPTGLSLSAENSNSSEFLRVNACNSTNAAIDPVGMTFRYVAFDV